MNLVQHGLMKLECVDGNRLFPSFSIEKTEYEHICQPWKDCLVVKLLGKSIGYLMLREKIRPCGSWLVVSTSWM
jgi:hypothetical protein